MIAAIHIKDMPLIVKGSGMREKEVEKKGGKEDKKYPTMPLMLFNFYRVIRSWRKGRDFFCEVGIQTRR